MQDLVKPLHDAVLARLTAGDQDQEVKDAAISAMATVLALAGDAMSTQLPATLQVCRGQIFRGCGCDWWVLWPELLPGASVRQLTATA